MEVETRVSVQAMRGKFEQQPEDNSLSCVPSPAPKLSTSPGRARTSSLIIRDKSNSCDNAKSCERLSNLTNNESECLSRNTKHSPNSASKTKSIFSPVLTGSIVAKALLPKKHSVDNAKDRKLSSETNSHEVSSADAKTTPSRKISETVVRRIPVFKSFNGGLHSEDRNGVKHEVKEPTGETPGRREKFLGHIRSRSHGNFMIKRDSSVESNGRSPNKGESTGKSENGCGDMQGKNYRQKSSDNLYGYRDSKCSSPFEGKQKLVANVVKNMKNKEKPKVLRKFSFSSKTEKELKNKKEKASPNKAMVGKTSPDMVPSTAKMKAIAKSKGNERKSSVTGSALTSGTVSVAKAVANIALAKASSHSPETSDTVPSPSDEASPPARPPRRRSATSGLSSHKKGMAPSPPGPPLTSPNVHKNDTAHSHGCERVPVIDLISDQRLIPDHENNRNQDSPDYYKSSDSLISPQSSDISRENSPVMISQNSPLLQKNKSNKSKVNVPEQSRVYSEGYCTSEEDKESKRISKNDCSTPFTSKSPDIENVEQPESECLPTGPPPKKPPRTFAYDIYRNGKECKSEEDMLLKENEPSEIVNPSSGPIYAVPIKKKKTENKPSPMPPVRSNSDLSKRDLVKPSVAPKPLHILNKVKRTSVVDPLSCAEKGEEAAMTSEFQRQAHIRYSLRRPKKPPPAPPPSSELDGRIGSESVKNPNVTKVLAKSNSSLSQNCYSSKNGGEPGSSPQVLNGGRNSPTNSANMNESFYHSVYSDEEDNLETAPFRLTSRSSYNLHAPTYFEDNQPLSLGHCPMDASSDLVGTFRKRSMSDETLYKGSRYGDEPIYAMPIFANNNGKGSRGHNRQRELHYMCSVLFTEEEEADAGRDGGGSGRGNATDGNKIKSSIISAWKKEFRQSCRQVQNKIKRTVNR